MKGKKKKSNNNNNKLQSRRNAIFQRTINKLENTEEKKKFPYLT